MLGSLYVKYIVVQPAEQNSPENPALIDATSGEEESLDSAASRDLGLKSRYAPRIGVSDKSECESKDNSLERH